MTVPTSMLDEKVTTHVDGSIVTLAKGHTHYKIYSAPSGSSDRPWVVMVHGFTMTAGMWVPFSDIISNNLDCNVLVYDLYGRGYSARNPNWDYGDDMFHDQLWQLVDKVVPSGTKVHLVGLSMGGALVVLAASKHPERTAGVVTLVPPGMKALSVDFTVRLMLSPYLGYVLAWSIGGAVVRKQIASGQVVVRDFTSKDAVSPKVVEVYLKFLMNAYDDPNFIMIARKNVQAFTAMQNLRPSAKRLGSNSTFPVDVILATLDKTCPPNEAAWNEDVPRCKVWNVKTGHMCIWEDFPRLLDMLCSQLGNQFSRQGKQ